MYFLSYIIFFDLLSIKKYITEKIKEIKINIVAVFLEIKVIAIEIIKNKKRLFLDFNINFFIINSIVY
jgi:hypothetical protein